MIRLRSGELLQEGTRVIIEGVGNGVVHRSKMVQSSNNAGLICLHTIKYEDGSIRDCNYAFIIVQCSMCNKPAKQYMADRPFCDGCADMLKVQYKNKNNINDDE